MVECEYVGTIDGKKVAVFYDGGYGWTAWLEGKGNFCWAFNALDAIEMVKEKLGLNELRLTFIEYAPRAGG